MVRFGPVSFAFQHPKGLSMLFLFAILRACTPSDPRPNDLLAEAQLRLGLAGFTVIALVFVLLTLWQS